MFFGKSQAQQVADRENGAARSVEDQEVIDAARALGHMRQLVSQASAVLDERESALKSLITEVQFAGWNSIPASIQLVPEELRKALEAENGNGAGNGRGGASSSGDAPAKKTEDGADAAAGLITALAPYKPEEAKALIKERIKEISVARAQRDLFTGQYEAYRAHCRRMWPKHFR
ncbi:MAG: hypothetical protein Q8P12_03540 [bacterium]|nr:hypothetical protein [bacterium]